MADASDRAWSLIVFGQAELCDARLTQRLVQFGAAIAALPGAGISQACAEPGAAKGAYRFLENPKVRSEPVTASQALATAKYCACLPVVLAVQDTTTFSYPDRPSIEDLGPVNDNGNTRGWLQHSTLALEESGRPLGLFHLQQWARDPQAGKVSHRRLERPLEEKESFKWIEGIRAARMALRTLPEAERPRLIHIGDREEDIHEVFSEIIAHQEGAVIRCSRDRCVAGPEDNAFQAVRQAPVLCTYELEVPRHQQRPKRTARLELRALTLTLSPNRRKHPQRQALALGLVEILEPDPPPGIEPLHWLLWTTEPIATAEETLRVVKWYTKRWHIEEFHRVLKEGLRAEEYQLGSLQRLSTLLAILSGIALRLMRLRDGAKTAPQAPCTEVLNDLEWRVLWGKIHARAPAPGQIPPTISQAVLWIGRLGGHLNRKGDGIPGLKTLWRGWHDLMLLIAGYKIAQDSG